MKKYELTQEQINQLAEKKYAKELLQEFLPEAFENKLEVGKVYKYPKRGAGKFMFKFNGKFGERITYGFNINGIWSNELGIYEYNIKYYEEATKEEWLEALKEEAKKRGFNNIGDLKIKNTYGYIRNGYHTINNDFYYDYISNTLNLDGVIIFKDGIWAEIVIEEIPTQEEIDRVINYLKNK